MKTIFSKNFDKSLGLMQDLKKNFRVRKSTNFKEIITNGGTQKVIFNDTNKFKGGLFLFGMVKSDLNAYIKENGYITHYDELPVNCINDNFDKKFRVVGVDINNAYWSIAYLKGYISENTYLKGLSKKEYKPIRLSALSSLGKSRTYEVFENGIHVRNEIKVGNDELQNFYLDIRYSTYGVMYEVANKLGNDFHSWKTDCIIFKDTIKNRKLVMKMINDYGLECKIEEKDLINNKNQND